MYAFMATLSCIFMTYLTFYSFYQLTQYYWIPINKHGQTEQFQFDEAKEHALQSLQTDIYEKEKKGRSGSCIAWMFEPKENPLLRGAGPGKMPIFTILGLFIVSLFWSIALYYLFNLLDWCLCVLLNRIWPQSVVQCIKLWDWQYQRPFRSVYERGPNPTDIGYIDEFRWTSRMNSLSWIERGGFVLPLPGFDEGVSTEINIPVCHWRLVPLMAITWICTFALFTIWRFSQKMAVKRAKHQERALKVEHAAMSGLVGQSGGERGMFTQVLRFVHAT
jgi:hypothetical protein